LPWAAAAAAIGSASAVIPRKAIFRIETFISKIAPWLPDLRNALRDMVSIVLQARFQRKRCLFPELPNP
jgi:hypothetical protein